MTISCYNSKLSNHESLVDTSVILQGETSSLKLKPEASEERRITLDDKLKTAAKHHKQDLQCTLVKHELDVDIINLYHKNAVGKLKYKSKKKDLELRSTVAQMSKLQDEVKKIQNKSKKYDKISAQGAKAFVQNRVYNERPALR